ncbi:alkaline phosphatase family protein [Mucilaginibacter antarcticus]|uniref:Alkaline phosphatase family protein n=1 Tax=Mucilaginibacter antarcticus TaxID=1855725 RepID=A0ABW5XKW9_9SPHI
MIKKLSVAVLVVAMSLNIQAQTRNKTLYVIADGIPADVLERLDLPNIKRIAKEGSYSRMHVGGDKGTYNQTPTISAVGYNSLLTGTWVNKHNVPDNDIKEPNYNYPTIFKLLKDQYPQKKTAIFSSWTDNRTKLLGYDLPATGNFKVNKYFDGYELDTARYKHDRVKNYMHLIDEQVISDAVVTLKTDAPDLSWVYLEYTDDMGHMYGDSPQMEVAVKMLDEQIGKLYAAVELRKKQHKENWLFIITTDHGRDEKTGKGHGGQSTRQRTTWVVSNQKLANKYATYYQPAIVDIMPTIARFMNITLPLKVAQEIDGIPMIGAVSITNANVNYIQGNIDVSWTALENTGSVKVWLTTTNNFKASSKDDYKLVAEVPLADGHALIGVKHSQSSFYKIVLEAPNNMLNRWLETPK